MRNIFRFRLFYCILYGNPSPTFWTLLFWDILDSLCTKVLAKFDFSHKRFYVTHSHGEGFNWLTKLQTFEKPVLGLLKHKFDFIINVSNFSIQFTFSFSSPFFKNSVHKFLMSALKQITVTFLTIVMFLGVFFTTFKFNICYSLTIIEIFEVYFNLKLLVKYFSSIKSL